MLLYLIFLVFYRNTVRINTQAKVVSIEDFGFEEGGQSNTRFVNHGSSNSLFFAVFDSEEQKEFNKQRVSNRNSLYACNQQDLYRYFKNVSEIKENYHITVDKPTILYYKLFECGNVSTIDVKLVNIFSNKSTRMDTRWIGIIQAKLTTLVIFFLILCYWFVNWFLHFRVQIWIHYLFTLTFVLAFLIDTVRFYELRTLEQQDISAFWTPLRVVLDIVGSVTAFTTLLLASKGWCIIRDEISVTEMLLSVLYSIIFVILLQLPQYFYLGVFELPVFLFSLIFVGLYVRELIVSINDASLHILAHMIAISNEGIDPQTTPVYRKHQMYQYFEGAVIAGCTLVLIKICLSMFIEIKLWISETLTDVIEIILLLTIEIIFRLRGTSAAGYETVISQNKENNEIHLDDIETFKDNGGRKWEEGMPLPGMPNIVKGDKSDQEKPQEKKLPTIIISSPDGTEATSAVVEKIDDDEA